MSALSGAIETDCMHGPALSRMDKGFAELCVTRDFRRG